MSDKTLAQCFILSIGFSLKSKKALSIELYTHFFNDGVAAVYNTTLVGTCIPKIISLTHARQRFNQTRDAAQLESS